MGRCGLPQGDSVGRITTSGKITIYGTSPRRQTTSVWDLGVQDITVGPDGALWFTKKSGNAIGRITTGGKITEYTAGISASAGPYFDRARSRRGALVHRDERRAHRAHHHEGKRHRIYERHFGRRTARRHCRGSRRGDVVHRVRRHRTLTTARKSAESR